MIRLNVVSVGRNRAERLTRPLVTGSVNAVDCVVQQLNYDAVTRLQQGLERAYSTVRLPCSVVVARVSRWHPRAYVGKVKGVAMYGSRNRQKVVLPK